MGAPHVSREQLNKFKKQSWELRKQGLSVSQIAEKIGPPVTYHMVNYYIYGAEGSPYRVPSSWNKSKTVKAIMAKKDQPKAARVVSVLGSPMMLNGQNNKVYFIAGLIRGAGIDVQDVVKVLESIDTE